MNAAHLSPWRNTDWWTDPNWWLESISGLVTWLCLAVVLAVLLQSLRGKRASLVGRAFMLFGILLGASEIGPLMDVVTIWWPAQRLEGIVRASLAIVSVFATAVLVRSIPRAITFRDRENLETAEHELRQSKSRFERALSGAASGLWEWNIDADEVWFSSRFKELLGYDGDEFPSERSSWELAIHPRDKNHALTALYGHIEKDTAYDIRCRLRTKSGAYRWFQARGLAIRDSAGRPYLMAGSIQDIHERKRAQAMLRRRNAQLRQAQKMEAVGTLAGGVAHEFNNLLQAIQGYTRFAMEGLNENDRRYQDLQQVLCASERAATLTRQLLGFSRRERLQLANVDANSLVKDIVKMLRPLIGESIEIVTDLEEGTNLVHGDAGQLQQVLMNLCVNARDAMPKGGRLLIKTKSITVDDAACDLHPPVKPGTYCMLTVADSGCGISSAIKDRIFDPFFTTKDVGEGTGLGLAMAYGIVRQHHGAIRVQSRPGIGTAFQVFLPTIVEPQTIAVPPGQLKLQGGTETILIAEDDALVRNVAVRTLESVGYHTIAAGNGEEAVRLFEENRDSVSLALLDVVMPRLSGRETLQRIRIMKPTVPALFCSSYEPQLESLGQPLHDNLPGIQKPFSRELLLQRIREALDQEPCQAN